MSDSSARVTEFLAQHRRLLDCYGSILPDEYKLMDPQMQRDFCFQERVRLEETVSKGKVSIRDFFAAATH